METNNIINENMETVIEEFVADEVVNTGFGINKYAKIGLGGVAVAAAAWLIKKGYDFYKSKKELSQPDHEVIVDDAELAEVVEPEA